MSEFDRERVRRLAGSHARRDEVLAALEDPHVTSTERFLRRLFGGPPNTAIDNSYVPARLAFAKAWLADRPPAQDTTFSTAPSEPWPGLGAPVFCSDGLPAEHGVAGDPFRFVAGDLRVAGNLYLSGQLLVAGNVVVDGVIDSGDWHALLVLGDVDCRALDCSESYALIEGSLRAKELVLVDDGAIVRVGGELVSPALISGELGAGETSVAGAPRECDLDLNEPARHALFVDGVVGPEDAVFSWHLMRALRRGRPVWRVKQTQFTDSSSS